MDDEQNGEGKNCGSKRTKFDTPDKDLDAESTMNANDVTMMEVNETVEQVASTSHENNVNGEDESEKNISQNNHIVEPANGVEATPGTSTTNKSPTPNRRRAFNKPKSNRHAKRNYRLQLSSLSSSSNRTTPELRHRSESTESSIQVNGDNDRTSTRAPDDDDDDDEWQNDDDDDDDDDSSDYDFDYPHMGGSDSEESAQSKTEGDANIIKDEILAKPKPAYSFNLLFEVMNREHGLTPNGRKVSHGRSSQPFHERIYGARQTIERLELLHNLQEHDGCVNSLNFNKAGTLLASGSDDLKIILWDWASKKVKYSLNSGHSSNVFQTKFIEMGGGGDINIVSSARDGQVRYTVIPPGGRSSDARSRVLLKHAGSVHKVSPSPHSTYEVLTAGEDGQVFRCDLRESQAEKVCAVKVKKRKVPLYSIAHNPIEPHFCVCGRDQFVRVFDKRNTRTALNMMCPQHLENNKAFITHITCAVYNSSGSEILASYSDEYIYSFNTRMYTKGSYRHRYRGHNNNKTIKGVNYFGLNSEYVVSGSDCGNFFIWDRETEAILNWKKADNMGVVNCLEPHPSFPVLATSGLDSDIKIWAPVNDKNSPVMEGLEKCLRNNSKRLPDSNLFDDRTLYFFVRQCLRNRHNFSISSNNDCPSVDDFLSTDSDDDENDCDDDDNLNSQSFPPCTPQ